MKLLAILTVPWLLTGIVILTGEPKSSARSASKSASLPTSPYGFNLAPQQPSDRIDGATSPSFIPDRVAYSLLFRLFANRPTDVEKSRIRAYIRQIGLSPADIESLILAAAEFQGRVEVLDARAKQIKIGARGNPNPEAKAQLGRLQDEKDAIVNETVGLLTLRLSPEGVDKLRHHINEHVKRRARFRPVDNFP